MCLHHLDLTLLTRNHSSHGRDGNNQDEADYLAAHDRGHSKLDLVILDSDGHIYEFEIVWTPDHQCETDQEMAQSCVDREHIEHCENELTKEVN